MTYALKSDVKTTGSEKRKKLSGSGAFKQNHASLYKKNDFRCIKPVEGKPPEEWPHYEMVGYRAAKTKEELDAVEEVPFDKHFFGMHDPEVFKKMTGKNKSERKRATKLWKKTYGWDYMSFDWGLKDRGDMVKCMAHCLRAEQRKFARDCKANGGLFKCCINSLRVDSYEKVRYDLYKKKLIESGPTDETRVCDMKKRSKNCHFCIAIHLCSIKDGLTQKVNTTFEIPYKRKQWGVGGRFDGQGFKYYCSFYPNSCKKQKHYENYVMDDKAQKYREAATAKELCDIKHSYEMDTE